MADNSYVTEKQMNAFLAKLNSSGVGGGSAPALGSIGNPYVNPTDIGSLAVGSYYITYTGDNVNLFHKNSTTTVYNYFTNPRMVSTGTPNATSGVKLNATNGTLSWQTGSSRGWALGTTTCVRGVTAAGQSEFWFDINISNIPAAAVGSLFTCQVWRDTTGTLEISVDWRNSSGSTISSNVQGFTVAANTVQKLTNTNLPMPSGAVSARFLIDFYEMTAGTGIGEATNLKFGADATLFDGDTAAANGYTYAWTGTANASSSMKTG